MGRTTSTTPETAASKAMAATEYAVEQLTAPADMWATLAPPVRMPDRKVDLSARINVIEDVPEPIRQRAEASLAINTERVKAAGKSTAMRPRVDYDWLVQPVADIDMAQAFARLLTRYAKYRPSDKPIPHEGPSVLRGQVTARVSDATYYRTNDTGQTVACGQVSEGAYLGVRYSVRPFEQRGSAARLPGTV